MAKNPSNGEEETLPKVILIGNSNVGKSSIMGFLVKGVHKWVGKAGKNPGTTLRIKPLRMPHNFELVDMPGFVKGTSHDNTKQIWDKIIHFVETNAKSIRLALIIISIENFRRNVEKWEDVQIPVDIEMGQFLQELGIPIKVVANKIDKLLPIQVQEELAFVAEKMHIDRSDIFPTSAKLGKGLKEVKEYVMGLFQNGSPAN
jgi:small GTP-binding protein